VSPSSARPGTWQIRTPEAAVFEFELAGPASRALAWLADRLVVGLATAAAGTGLSLADLVAPGLGGALFLVVYFVLDWGYHAGFEWRSNGQTPGKRLVGLRVMSDRGLRLTLAQAVVRNLFRLIDGLPVLYLLGGCVAALEEHGRRLGDLAAGTVVVRVRRLPAPARLSAGPGRGGRLPWEPDEAGRVRRRLSVGEGELVLSLAMRREQLDLGVRLDLFRRVSAHLQRRLDLPRPPSLSDENYVLHVAAVLAGGEGGPDGAARAS